MVKIDNKLIYNNNKMDPRKLEKIQIYPSKQHTGYNKMSNQLPKLTKTIMSPLTTMPPKKLMTSPHNGVIAKPPQTPPKASEALTHNNNNNITNSMQYSAMSNNYMRNSPNLAIPPKISPIVIAPTKTELKPTEKPKDAAAATSYKLDKISLDAVHPYITCSLCKGYLIEATTIVECLHTYCHSCLMKHLTKEKSCPQCDMSINKSKTNIKYDATIQSIVYKLVPGLYKKELFKRREFYKQKPDEAKLASPEDRGEDTEHLILSPLDLISLSLDYAEKETLFGMESDESVKDLLKPKYLNCPAIFKVEHLKKFITSKFKINTKKFIVEISYKVKTIVLPDHYTLMDVAYIYTWKKEAPMPFFFRIIAKNSKCDELPEVALRRSPPTTLPNVAEDTLVKKKSVSFKEEVTCIEKSKHESANNKTDNGVSKSASAGNESKIGTIKQNAAVTNPPRIETIKLKLDVSNNNVSIIKNTPDSASSPTSTSSSKKDKKKEKKNKLEPSSPKYPIDTGKRQSQPKIEQKKDEYEFEEDIEQQKLGFLNTFQLTAKKILNAAAAANTKNDSEKSPKSTECTSTATNNKNNLSHKPTEQNVSKRKSKEPVKTAPKKYKFHEMKSVGEGNKFLFTKTGDGHEIMFDMSPQPLGSKPSLSKVKSDIMLAQQRADASKASKVTEEKSKVVPMKPKKLPMLLPKQPSPPSPVPTPVIPPSAVSPTAFVIKKPEPIKKDFPSNEISVTKINEQNPSQHVFGPKSMASPKPSSKETPPAAPVFKSPDGFAQPLPPKVKSNALPLPPPQNILKPYGYQMKLPKNIPENMQTPYGCRTPFYVPSSPSYTPNFDPKPQFKYANPNAYASFMQSMFSPAPPQGKTSPPIKPLSENAPSKKRPSTETPPVAAKRKTPSPTKPAESDSKTISILNKINFPPSLSVTLTNEQEENKKEQLRSQKQNVVNNNIEIIKISEERDAKAKAAAIQTPTVDKKTASDKKLVEVSKKVSPSLPPLVPNPSMLNAAQMLPPPVAKALNESKETFQWAFLESLMTVASKQQGIDKSSAGRKKEASKAETSGRDEKDKVVNEIKNDEAKKNPSINKAHDGKKNISLTPPPTKPEKALMNNTKSLTPPPIMPDPSMYNTNAAQVQFNLMMNALNAAAKAPFTYPDYANIQRSMLLETLRQNVEKSSQLLAMHHQIQQQQQHQKSPSSSHSPSSSASSHSTKH